MENYLKDAPSTRDKILHATLKIIGKEGFQNITIKKIADMAEVNIAAVNYHFGSKTNVINEAIKLLNDERTKCFGILEQKELPPLERLSGFLYSYVGSALEYPDVFRNFIYCAINNCLDNNENIVLLRKEGFEKIRDTIIECGISMDNEVLMMKLVQVIGCVQFPILVGKQMEQMTGLDFNEDAIKDKYVDLMLISLLRE
ncbi:MAG: transcriptional regulator, TetR family [Clostridia bacterium]|jgi:AcrR family transcriptional regulator|nr:transcriptional regulator, TetR family [Clostridia bacterium]